jgi:hypothetical protein
VRFQVLTASSITMTAFRDIAAFRQDAQRLALCHRSSTPYVQDLSQQSKAVITVSRKATHTQRDYSAITWRMSHSAHQLRDKTVLSAWFTFNIKAVFDVHKQWVFGSVRYQYRTCDHIYHINIDNIVFHLTMFTCCLPIHAWLQNNGLRLYSNLEYA